MSDEIQAMGYGWPIWRAAKEDTRSGTKPTDSAEIVPDRVRELERERFEKWRATWNVGYAPDEWTVWQAAKEDGSRESFPKISDEDVFRVLKDRYVKLIEMDAHPNSLNYRSQVVEVLNAVERLVKVRDGMARVTLAAEGESANKLPNSDMDTNELPDQKGCKHGYLGFCVECDKNERIKILMDEVDRLVNINISLNVKHQDRIAELERESGHLKRSDSYIIGQLLQCVEEAEGLIDGGDITRKAEKHVKAWLKRQDDLKLHMKKSQADTYDLATRLGAECEELREMLTGADRQLADAWKERDELRTEVERLHQKTYDIDDIYKETLRERDEAKNVIAYYERFKGPAVQARQLEQITKERDDLRVENERLRKMRAKEADAIIAFSSENTDLRTILEAVRSQMCWERDRDELTMGMRDLHDAVTKALQHASSHVTSDFSHVTGMSDFKLIVDPAMPVDEIHFRDSETGSLLARSTFTMETGTEFIGNPARDRASINATKTPATDFPSSEFRKWFDEYCEHGGVPLGEVCARWGWSRRDPSELIEALTFYASKQSWEGPDPTLLSPVGQDMDGMCYSDPNMGGQVPGARARLALKRWKGE